MSIREAIREGKEDLKSKITEELKKELATKYDIELLKKDIDVLRQETHKEIATLRQEMHKEIGILREEMHKERDRPCQKRHENNHHHNSCCNDYSKPEFS